MGLEAGRQRSGVSNTMRSRIVRIGAKHIPQDELNQMLAAADFAPLKEKEIAFTTAENDGSGIGDCAGFGASNEN